jgi:hypothetical protein
MAKSIIFFVSLIFVIAAGLILSINEITIETYQYIYFLSAIVIWFLGYHFFGGRFIRPEWKKGGKLIAYLGISGILIIWVGHYALIFIIGHQLLGGIGHLVICKKNGIDWKTCQPEEKYLELTNKWAKGKFS